MLAYTLLIVLTAESNFSMTLQVDLHLLSTEEFLSVITRHIYINCQETWFCIQWQSYTIVVTSLSVTIKLLCLRMH